MEQKEVRTRETIQPVLLDMPDGGELPFFSVGDAAIYLGLSPAGLLKSLKKHPEVEKYGRLLLGKAVYIKVADIKRLNTAYVIKYDEEIEIEE